MSRDTFRAAVFYYQDFSRGECLNVGVVLASPQTKFCKARMLSLGELHPIVQMFGDTLENAEWYARVLLEYSLLADEAKELGRDFSLRFDHPHIFTALFGRNNETSCLGWRDGASGLVTKSPQETLDYYFEIMVRRPTREVKP